MFRRLSSGTIRSAALVALAVGAIGGTSALAAALPNRPQGNSPTVQQENPTSPATTQPAQVSACKNDGDKNDDQGEPKDPAASAKHDADKAARKAKHDADKAAHKANPATDKTSDSKSGSDSSEQLEAGEKDEGQAVKGAAPSGAEHDANEAGDLSDGAVHKASDKCATPAKPAPPAGPGTAESPPVKPAASPSSKPAESPRPKPSASASPSDGPQAREWGRSR